MATVGSLFINVKARTASFSKKMESVRATVTRMAKGFGRMAAKVGKFAAVIGGVAVAALIAMTKAGLSSVDMVTKLARSMNTGTEGIIALQHAAKIGGVSTEKMDKAIGKMFKNVGEAEMGVGMAKRSLDELGLSAKALGNMQADEMFGAISEELSKVESAAVRARMANDLFGRAGIELIPVMLDGAKGIRDLRKEADELGITFGAEQGHMVEKANDAWARIGSIWKGLTQQLAIEFAPILTLIANKIKEFVINAGGIGQVAEFIVKGFFYAGAAVLDVVRAIQIGWLGLKTAVIQVASDITLAMSWATQKIAQLFYDMQTLAFESVGVIAKAFGWAADKTTGILESLGADNAAAYTRGFGSLSEGVGKGMDAVGSGRLGRQVESEMADWLRSIGVNLGDEATDTGRELIDKLAEGWNLGKADTFFDNLKDKMMGEGWELAGGALQINADVPDLKGVADSLETAIGSMKVEGDAQSMILKSQHQTEKDQLRTQKEIVRELRNGGGQLR